MSKHPLTDEICERISRRCVSVTTSIERDNMRAAYDKGRNDQLEQVMKWLDRYLDSFGISDEYYRGECESIFDLKDDLKKAMRPQENN